MSQPISNDPPPTPARPSRLEFIDALRGFACVWVLLCHVQGFWLVNVLPSTHRPLRLVEAVAAGFCKVGVAGVDLFIVLSGFCLYWPVVRGWKRGGEFSPGVFFKRRARRIVPAYYAAVLLCTAIALYPPLQRHFVAIPPRFIGVVAYLGFFMTFLPSQLPTINGTYWSIALEAQLYLAFPPAVWLARKVGLWAVVAAGLFVTGGWQFVQYSGLGTRFGLSGLAYLYHLPARYLEFVLGMVAAALATSPRKGQGTAGLVAAAVALPVALWCAKYDITVWSELMYSAWGVVFAGLILGLAEWPAHWFTHPLRAGLLTRVGIVSYSLYLLHAPAMLLSTDTVLKLAAAVRADTLTILAAFLLVGIPLLIVPAYGFYLLFEKPFMNPAKRPGPLPSPDPDHPNPADPAAPVVGAGPPRP